MIKFQISGQTLRVVSPRIVSGTDRYLTASCKLSSDWDNATGVFAHFKNDDAIFDILLDENYGITEDKRLNLTDGLWTVWFTSQTVVDGEIVQRITTNAVELEVENVIDGNDNPTDFPSIVPTVAEQAVADCIDNRKATEQAKADAEAAAEKAESVSSHPPEIGENENWHQWDFEAQEYVDTGKPSKGTPELTPEQLTEITEKIQQAIEDEVPFKLSDLESDSSHRTVSDAEKDKWNNKSDFSGNYDDLIGKPYIPSLDGYATEQWVESKNYLIEHQDISGKVDKVDGMGLSHNDFTDADKAKLNSALQSVPVTYRTAAEQDIIDYGKQSTIGDLDAIRTGAAKGATAVQPESGKGLFSGDYNDLNNKPTIPSLNGYATEQWVEDKNYLTTHQDISGKVDKVEGMGLSHNDFTDTYKDKLEKGNFDFEEVDPTVPAWAKAESKPTYTADEITVGDTDVASELSRLKDADDYTIHYEETDEPDDTEELVAYTEFEQVTNLLNEELKQKLDKPADQPVVGKVLKVKTVNEDGSFLCEWADAASGNIELQSDGEYIQYKTDGEWLNIVPLADLKGAPGERGLDGTDYLLKPKDLNEIADLVMLKLPNGNEARY